MSKEIYLLYSCNEWKEYASMSLVVATTSLQRLKSVIANCIKNDEMDYNDEESSRANQVKNFKKDMDERGLDWVKSLLQYGTISVVSDGEVQ